MCGARSQRSVRHQRFRSTRAALHEPTLATTAIRIRNAALRRSETLGSCSALRASPDALANVRKARPCPHVHIVECSEQPTYRCARNDLHLERRRASVAAASNASASDLEMRYAFKTVLLAHASRARHALHRPSRRQLFTTSCARANGDARQVRVAPHTVSRTRERHSSARAHAGTVLASSTRRRFGGTPSIPQPGAAPPRGFPRGGIASQAGS